MTNQRRPPAQCADRSVPNENRSGAVAALEQMLRPGRPRVDARTRPGGPREVQTGTATPFVLLNSVTTDPYHGGTPAMRWARFEVAALAFVASCLSEPIPASAM